MVLLKILILLIPGIIYILSQRSVFSEYFEKNKFTNFLAEMMAVFITILLVKDLFENSVIIYGSYIVAFIAALFLTYKTYKIEEKYFQYRLRDGSLGPKMAWIPEGSFQMGGNEDSYEKPIHRVSVSKFAMGQYEVTFAEYDKFAGATGRNKPSDQGWGRGNRPVINVSWRDATAYAKWLSEQTGKNYRLPTEAEWEYAARAGTSTKYWWGNDVGSNNGVCHGCGSQWDDNKTAPVGSFEANSFGLYDVHGNVWEWVQDCWNDNYYNAPSNGSPWTSGNCSYRVLRGGSWRNEPPLLRSTRRYGSSVDNRDWIRGFRVSIGQ